MLVIDVGQLIIGNGNEPLDNATILVEHGRIREVGPRGSVRLPASFHAIDAPGLCVLPGFVDTHVHLTFSAGPDHQAVTEDLRRCSDEQLFERALINGRRCLAAGVTTVRDCGGRGLVTLLVRDAIKSGQTPGPRVLVSGPAITTAGGHMDFLGAVATGEQQLRAIVRRLVGAGVDFIKVCVTGGVMTASSQPRRAQYSAGELAAVAEEAHRHGRPVCAHALGTEGIRNAAIAGADTVEHCFYFAPEAGFDYDSQVVQMMIDKHLWVGVTLSGVYRELVTKREAASVASARFSETLDVLRWQLRAGVQAALGSDAGVRITFFDQFALSIRAAIELLGLSPLEAITMATKRGAELLGLQTEIGTIEVGKRADLVAVRGDPLSDPTTLGAVEWVLQNGRRVHG